MFCAGLLSLPMHAGGAPIVNLHAIHAEVAFAGFGIARDHTRQGDEAAGVFWPALENGKVVERKAITENDFLARPGGNRFRKELSHLREQGDHLYLVEEALRGLHIHKLADAVGHLAELVDFEREIHAAGGAELIDEHLGARMAFDVLEKEGWAAGRGRPASIVSGGHLGCAVSDFGDLEYGVDFGTDLS